MSKILTFSRFFPKNHKEAGKPTHFIEKIYAGLADELTVFDIPNTANEYWDWHEYYNCDTPKVTTIRKGKRWKPGDWFSPRVWTGKPYQSKQVAICGDIQVKKTYDIEINLPCEIIRINQKDIHYNLLPILPRNDGLSFDEWEGWFGDSLFEGQIICWSDNVDY